MKGKKLSVDFGTLGKAFMPDSPRGPPDKSGQSSMVPSVIVSRFVLFTALRYHEAPLDPVIETLQTRKSPSAVGNSRPSVRIYLHCTRLSPIELDSCSQQFVLDSRHAQPAHAWYWVTTCRRALRQRTIRVRPASDGIQPETAAYKDAVAHYQLVGHSERAGYAARERL